MQTSWEPFTGGPYMRQPHTFVRVTLCTKKTLYLSKPAYEALGKPRAVELLFNEQLNAIGIRPSSLTRVGRTKDEG